MRFPDRFLDDIRDQLRISEVVGQRVQFDKKKTNAAKGDFWGNELDGLHFHEAVELLANQAGLQVPIMDKREQEKEEKRKSLFEVMELAGQFFQSKLHEPVGANARAYLRDRGLSPQIQQEFGIGFAPDSRNALKEFLASKGIDAQQMEACGLINHGEGIAVSYDKFRGRVMFPIPDARGRVIAFGGRALSDDALAKYMNSPETELFHKSNVLYNFAKARKPAYDKKQVIAAEGYMDVIALNAAGFPNAVAPLGTALTDRQMELLWRMHPEPILCFDGDGAGLKAAHRAIDMALPNIQPGRSVRFAMLPEGKDPDDLIKEEGPEAMREVIDSALPLADMLWNREIASGIYTTPERRAELQTRMRQIVNSIKEESVRYHYDQNMRERLSGYFSSGSDNNRTGGKGSSYKGGYAKQKQGAASGGKKFSASPSLLGSKLVKKGHGGMPLREAALVGGMIFHPALGVEFFEEVSTLDLQSNDAKMLQSVFLDCFANWPNNPDSNDDFPNLDFVMEAIREKGLGNLLEAVKQHLIINNLWQILPNAAFEDARDGWMQSHILHLKNQTLHKELKVAERALADDDSQDNLERLLQIQQELSRSDGIEALIDGFGASSGRTNRGF